MRPISLISSILALCAPAWLTACSGKQLEAEESFVYAYTQEYCAWQLDCYDPAMRVWDGVEGTEECEAELGPELAAKASGCKIVSENADRCLQRMAELPCPEEGQDPEEALPVECEVAWKKCSLTAEGLD